MNALTIEPCDSPMQPKRFAVHKAIFYDCSSTLDGDHVAKRASSHMRPMLSALRSEEFSHAQCSEHETRTCAGRWATVGVVGEAFNYRAPGCVSLLPPSLILSSLELSDTKGYEPYIRACLGTASHFCETAVRKSRTLPNGTTLGSGEAFNYRAPGCVPSVAQRFQSRSIFDQSRTTFDQMLAGPSLPVSPGVLLYFFRPHATSREENTPLVSQNLIFTQKGLMHASRCTSPRAASTLTPLPTSPSVFRCRAARSIRGINPEGGRCDIVLI